LLTNQLGYVQQHEHLQFETDKCIELWEQTEVRKIASWINW
jgi:predicted metal-dependent phosphotriesterase family hydrolase